MAVYAVSDIHGHYDLFLRGLVEISFTAQDYLWCLGDMIDKGPDGIRILQHIMKHDNMDLLIGNHEFMLLNSVDEHGKKVCNGKDAHLWLDVNGGWSTFYRYKELHAEERIGLLDWLKQRYVVRMVEIEGQTYCLTHSFYNHRCEDKCYCDMPYSDVWNITWSSIWREDPFTHALDIYSDYEYTFICGHVPVQIARAGEDPEEDSNVLKSLRHDNLINIDGGCAIEKNGNIENGAIFLRLNDMREFVIPR